MQNNTSSFIAPAARLISSCKRRKFQFKAGDSRGGSETGGSLLTRTLVLRRLLRRHVLEPNEQKVGILIPPSVAGTIANLALTVDKRVAVNLSYAQSNDLINYCINQAKLKHVLTTRAVVEKFKLELDCETVFLEDIAGKATGVDKAIGAFQAYAVPAAVLRYTLGLNSVKTDDLMAVLFTSGTTGPPKGVMLTQQNVSSNGDAMKQVASLRKDDVLVGVLPFFHAMGYTVALWAAATCNVGVAYHYDPLDAKSVGKLTEKFGGSIIVAAPTFLRFYVRRCKPEQFKTLDVVVTGAERLPPELCEQFEQRFGVRPVEGYGTTELSPLAAVNIPYSRQAGDASQVMAKEGTVGRTIAGVAAKVTDMESGKELAAGQSGMLWISGPNVMKGYLDRPDATAAVLKDGWYKTGDLAMIDKDGFIKITGRVSRFSKIGGEMVPHGTIEAVLSKYLAGTSDDDDDSDLPLVAVTAVPDEKKGERLVVLLASEKNSVDEMRQALKDAELPNLCIPSADSFFHVGSLPILGSGKIDLKNVRELAERMTETA